MTRFVLWSGGCDSTLLLCQQAKEYPSEIISAISILGFGNTNGQKMAEHKAREKLKKLIPFKNINYSYITLNWTNTNLKENTTLPIWFCTIFPFLANDDILLLAYLSSDGKDFWLIRQAIIDAFKACCKLRDITASIQFPYEMNSKGFVIEELKKLKLFEATWWCGQPKAGKPCGECMKCISVKRWSKYPKRGIDT